MPKSPSFEHDLAHLSSFPVNLVICLTHASRRQFLFESASNNSIGLIPSYLQRQFNRWKDEYVPASLSMYRPFFDPNPCRFIGSPQVIAFGYRCFVSDKFQFMTVRLPEAMDFYKELFKGLKFLCIRSPLLEKDIMSIYSRFGRGLRDYILVRDLSDFKVTFDFLTLSNGWIGYFIVTVCLGVGITVWYAYFPGSCVCELDISHESLKAWHLRILPTMNLALVGSLL